MKCDKAIQEFLEQEDCFYEPLRVRLHTLLCPKCRKEIRNLKNIFFTARISGGGIRMPEDLSGLIMNRIAESGMTHEKNVSQSKWLMSGAIIFLSIFLVSYSDSFIWLRKYFGSGLEIPVNMVLGIVVTLYASLFAGTHLEDVKKIMDYINKKRIHP